MEYIAAQNIDVQSLLSWATGRLHTQGFESPRLTVELLLSHLLHCERIDLYADPEKPLSSDEFIQFNTMLSRRLAHEPVQYIIGETDFMGLAFTVDRRVLIPRPETEILIEQAIKLGKQMLHKSSISILDIGTGCGNIAISLSKFFGNVSITALDISRDALDVAWINVGRHKVHEHVRLYQRDIFSTMDDVPGMPFDLIVSNPPYVSEQDSRALPAEILDYEPLLAVLEGGDGFKFFHRIAEIGKQILAVGGWIAVETAYNQGSGVQSIFSGAGYGSVQVIKDYDGHGRVVLAQLVS